MTRLVRRRRCRAWLRAYRRSHPAAYAYPRPLCRTEPAEPGVVVLNGALVHLTTP